MAMVYLARTGSGERTDISDECSSKKAATAICRAHMGGRLTRSMRGSMSYDQDLEGKGWEEVASWFSDDDGYGDWAAVYRRREGTEEEALW